MKRAFKKMANETKKERALLAGGCFWGMQDLLRRHEGVLATRIGYCGGDSENPVYETVKTGTTGHAETLEIIFDPEKIGFRDLLSLFFQIHDPTTKDQQGNDRGSQYRSAIFYTSETQKKIAEETIKDVDASGLWPGPVVTEITKAGIFYQAEDNHQDYLERFPQGYSCHFPRANWVLPKRDG